MNIYAEKIYQKIFEKRGLEILGRKQIDEFGDIKKKHPTVAIGCFFFTNTKSNVKIGARFFGNLRTKYRRKEGAGRRQAPVSAG